MAERGNGNFKKAQPKPGEEKDYFDEVEEQQHRSTEPRLAFSQNPDPRFTYHTHRKSESEDDGNEAELEDLESMSTTGDELSEIDSPQSDPPPPYPGAKNGHQLRRTTRFLDPQRRKEIEEDGLADEYTKNPIATRRKSGGLYPLKNLSIEDDDDEQRPPSPEPKPSDGYLKNMLRGKLDYISKKVPKTKFRLRKRTPDEFKIQIFVSILFLMIVLLIGSIYVIHQEKELQKAYFNRIRFSSKDRKFRLSNLKGREVLSGMLGTSLTSRDKAWPCLKIHHRNGESCLEWMDKARLYFRLIASPTNKDSPSSLNPSLDPTAPGGQEPGSEAPPQPQQQCYGTQWESLSPNFIPMDCFYVNESRGFHFYGGGEQGEDHWPLNRTIVPLTPFVTGNKVDARTRAEQQRFQWGKFLKRQFFGAPGVSIEIWKDVPLHVSINSVDYPGMMCFAAKHDNFAYPAVRGQNLVLNYTVCTGTNVLEVTSTSLFASTRENLEDLRHEDVIFARRLVKTPIWQVMPSIFSNTSSNATSSSPGSFNGGMYFNDLAVNRNSSVFEKQLLDHADRIKAESLSEDNILLIDETWEKHLGDYEIDLDRFPTIIQTLNYTQRRGFQIAFSIQPYFSTESDNYIDGLNRDLWVKEKSAADIVADMAPSNESGGSHYSSPRNNARKVPALVQYKNSYTSVLLDVTKPRARTWFEEKVRSFVRKYSMNALFIDLGSTIDLPQYYEFHQGLQNPDDYKNLFIQSIRKGVMFVNTIGVSSAIKSPKLPTFISLSPVESSWTGLQSIIPNLLTLGITGFSFIMTGPIGGSYKRASQLPQSGMSSTLSAYEANKPDRNLYIRWLELTYFLPIVQYTYLPSDYDSNVLEIARYHKQLRESKVQSFIKKAIDESLTQGTAIIQPLWMIDPLDINCLVVSDQFTIGGQIMVAPILKPNSTERDIYLPKGKWRDELYGTTTKGEKWIHRHTVQEHQIAFFTKMFD